jgi:hypothetical protein
VEIRFADQKLQRCFVDERYACGCLGPKLARRYAYVVNLIRCVDDPSDLQRFAFLDTVAPPNPAECWTVSLGDRWRLILAPTEDGNAIKIMEVVQS